MKKIEGKFYSPRPNWLGWSKWLRLHAEEIITCCNCGLAHTFQFKVFNGRIKWRAKRNKEQTKLAREKYHNEKSKRIRPTKTNS